jgi:hypothetical protein
VFDECGLECIAADPAADCSAHCDSDSTNDCVEDCAGTWGGSLTADGGGVCEGDSANDNTTCTQDCAGAWGGSAAYDDCGLACIAADPTADCSAHCDEDSSNDCVEDCAGTWGGSLTADGCGVCDGDSNNDNTTCVQDCLGTWDGTAIDDECGVCDGPGIITYFNDSDGDGLGDPDYTLLACDDPGDNWSTDNTDDEINCGTNDTDECGVCAGDNSCADCTGTPNGTAVYDECGACDGSGVTTFYNDLDGDGLGNPDDTLLACIPLDADPEENWTPGENWTANSDDLEPDCGTNDTDECGVCAGSGTSVFYGDADGDGVGDCQDAVEFCSSDAPGWVSVDCGDCNDLDPGNDDFSCVDDYGTTV